MPKHREQDAWWSLPGPARFLERAATMANIPSGVLGVVMPMPAPRDWLMALTHSLDEQASATPVVVDASVGLRGRSPVRMPEWKQAEFSARYFEVDADFLSSALTLRPIDNGLAVYLRSVFEDERLVEGTLTELVGRPEINLRRPVTEDDWNSWVYKHGSDLALKAKARYVEATSEQSEASKAKFASDSFVCHSRS